MNKYEAMYMENKNRVLKLLQEAKVFLEGNEEYQHSVEIIEKQYETVENGEFSIVLVGEFSAGKSTLLNALMGEKILPSFTNETTATVNFLKHKNKSKEGEEGAIYFVDGRIEKIQKADFDTISKYVSAESEEDVAKNIKHLDLYLDSKFLENNVTLVDSPGLNGVADGHREITERQIEESSASIFMFNATRPGSQSDFEFLRSLQSKVKSIICVLNQIDCIKTSEGQRDVDVVKKLKENYKKMIPEADKIPEIYPISAYQALVARSKKKIDYNGRVDFSDEEKEKLLEKSQMRNLEDRLWKFLTQGEKAKQQLLAPLDQLEAIFNTITENNKTKLELLDGKLDITSLEEEQLKIEKQKAELEEKIKERILEIRESTDSIAEQLLSEIKSEAENIKNRLMSYLENWESIEDIETENIERELERRLNKATDNAVENYQAKIESLISRSGEKITSEMDETMDVGLFKFNNTSEIEKVDVHLGIEEYEQEMEAMEAEIREIDKNIEINEGNERIVRKEIRNKKRIEEKLKEKEQKKENYENIARAAIPDVYYRQETVEVETNRTGLFARTRDFLFGKRKKPELETIVDRKEHDEYIDEMKRTVSGFDEEIRQLEFELEEIGEIDYEEVEAIRNKLNTTKENKQKEINELREKYKKKWDKEIEKKLRRQKNVISDFIDDTVSDYEKHFKKMFRTSNEELIRMISRVVSSTLSSQLDQRNREMEIICAKMQQAVSDKEQETNNIQNEMSQMESIFQNLITLQAELKEIEVDEIKNQSI